MTALSSGSTATSSRCGCQVRNARPTPMMVPPVPTPAMNASSRLTPRSCNRRTISARGVSRTSAPAVSIISTRSRLMGSGMNTTALHPISPDLMAPRR